MSGAVCQVVAVLGFSPPTEEHPPWNLSFKEPSSLLPLGAERQPQKSGHPRDLRVRLSQGSLLRCLWMLLCDAYPLNEFLTPHTLGTPSCFTDVLFQAFQGSCPQVINSGRERDPGKAQVCLAGLLLR